ncbi:uncharacterized protein LOC126964487 [Leptidea sinapis]|uniref:uncharacterized protein LOC126964487 n=1 Tax=Leptidea sinapis TaxID=189913 RepID=UPI002124161D|nr:uncharacterized protein LOC126964487 [Leptidea sinapis]
MTMTIVVDSVTGFPRRNSSVNFDYILKKSVEVLFKCSLDVLASWRDGIARDMGSAASAQDEEQSASGREKASHGEGLGKMYMAEMKEFRDTFCCRNVLKTLFIVIGLLTIIQSVVVIAVTIASAIATKIFNKEQSGRLVAMIVLAVTAAVSISVIIYGVIGIFRKRKKPVHATAAVMLIMIIIQAVILGLAIRVTDEDEVVLNRSLVESFRLAQEDNPRHVKIWAATQSDLQCCGVYGPEDYRQSNVPNFFSPDVPISCCPGYDSTRSELVQERERESCKARHEYSAVGCRGALLEMFQFTAVLVLSNTVFLIICELCLGIVSAIISKEERKEEVIEEPPALVVPTPMPRASLNLFQTKSKP